MALVQLQPTSHALLHLLADTTGNSVGKDIIRFISAFMKSNNDRDFLSNYNDISPIDGDKVKFLRHLVNASNPAFDDDDDVTTDGENETRDYHSKGSMHGNNQKQPQQQHEVSSTRTSTSKGEMTRPHMVPPQPPRKQAHQDFHHASEEQEEEEWRGNNNGRDSENEENQSVVDPKKKSNSMVSHGPLSGMTSADF